jgi:hypothetical protein
MLTKGSKRGKVPAAHLPLSATLCRSFAALQVQREQAALQRRLEELRRQQAALAAGAGTGGRGSSLSGGGGGNGSSSGATAGGRCQLAAGAGGGLGLALLSGGRRRLQVNLAAESVGWWEHRHNCASACQATLTNKENGKHHARPGLNLAPAGAEQRPAKKAKAEKQPLSVAAALQQLPPSKPPLMVRHGRLPGVEGSKWWSFALCVSQRAAMLGSRKPEPAWKVGSGPWAGQSNLPAGSAPTRPLP